MKKNVIIFTIFAMLMSITGCATTNYQKGLSKTEQKKAEKENEFNFIKGISTFAGFVLGGLVGILTGPKDGKITSLLQGCVIGSGVGFGTAFIVIENVKNNDPKADASKADERFKDYRSIKGKE